MEDFLRKLKLVDNLRVELKIGKSDFVSKLSGIVDKGSTSFFSDTFDIFSKSKNEFKGEVNINSFKIKRKKRFLDANYNTVIASGNYYQKEDSLIVESEIRGFHKIFYYYYAVILLFYLIFFFGFAFWNNDQALNLNIIMMLFIIIHAAFMISLPLILMKKAVRKMKRELEREFIYITQV